MYFYNIPIEMINISVNKKQNFQEQQAQKRRPRFSIIKSCIVPNNIDYYAQLDLKTKKIIKNIL